MPSSRFTYMDSLQRRFARPPIFLFRSGSHLTRAAFVRELWKALLGVGWDPNYYSGHSFRRGAATTAAASGIPDSHIKLLGRWRSEAFQVYLKPSDHQMANLVARLSGQSPSRQQHLPATPATRAFLTDPARGYRRK